MAKGESDFDFAEARRILAQGANGMIWARDVVKKHPWSLQTPKIRRGRVKRLVEWHRGALNLRERARAL